MYFWYKFFTYLFFPFSFAYLFLRKLKKKEHPTRYLEKLGKIEIERGENPLIWFHVASVGEAMSILPLIENFEKNEKIKKILITTITLSSGQILQKRYSQSTKVFHQFLPLDIPNFINKFLNHWNPNLAIFIDSEIWPNLILEIKKRNISLLLVNARITKKTFLRWKFFKNFAKKIFEKFDLCIVANKETENHLKSLGALNIKNYGNLKFAKTKATFIKKLNEFKDYDNVGEIRGIGLMGAIEIVKDKTSKTPFESSLSIGEKIAIKSMENGLICRPIGASIVLCPQFIVTEKQLDDLFNMLHKSLKTTFENLN